MRLRLCLGRKLKLTAALERRRRELLIAEGLPQKSKIILGSGQYRSGRSSMKISGSSLARSTN
jgi:hypothetical protein